VRAAARSLTGEFSREVRALRDALVDVRMYTEATLDFPEEDLDLLREGDIAERLDDIRARLAALLARARSGALLREGLAVVLVGAPNVGKSSILNRLVGEDAAIVTPIPGTTRDYVRATVSLEGVPIHLVDTAGLREASEEVERIGIERTWRAIESAGAALFIEDARGAAGEDLALRRRLPSGLPLARVVNKIDVDGGEAGRADAAGETTVRISAKTGAGLEAVRAWLLDVAGWRPHGEGLFMARERHLRALESARGHLETARAAQAFELKAEEYRLAQSELGRITGDVHADDLLGEIFSRFCIGK
jgi:tRNA modification GTPase